DRSGARRHRRWSGGPVVLAAQLAHGECRGTVRVRAACFAGSPRRVPPFIERREARSIQVASDQPARSRGETYRADQELRFGSEGGALGRVFLVTRALDPSQANSFPLEPQQAPGL